MKAFVLAVTLFGVAINAQGPPCSGSTICLSNCPLDPRCPPVNPAKPVLLPANVCTRFLKCHDGRACPMDCPPGLHFNTRKDACDWPHQACCDPSVECRPDPCGPGGGCNPGPGPVPIPPPQPIPQPQPSPGPCSGSTICLVNCPVDSRCPPFNPAKAVLLPHTDCTRFFKCHDGRACPYECPSGLHFNPRKDACDWPHQACCDPRVECRPDPCGPGGGCNPGPVPTPPPPVIIPTPPPPCSGSGGGCDNCEPTNLCPPFNPSKPVLLSHVNCNKYYKCETGRRCEMDCPAGLHFNLAKQICDWPWFACCDRSIECRPNPCDNGGGVVGGCPPNPQPPTCVGWNCFGQFG